MTKVLIIGGTGSLGQALINHYIVRNDKVIAYSRDEAKHWTIKNNLVTRYGSKILDDVKFVVGDIRDQARLTSTMWTHKPNIVIVAAALKQVDTCELSPYESVLTNLIGTENVNSAVEDYARASDNQVTILFVSTDKACAPVNVYGMCKAISERLVTSRSTDDPERNSQGNRLVYSLGVRYGNVLESRGSIIPLFKYQAEKMFQITVTHRDMTRFLMTLDDSVNLIQNAIDNGRVGDIFVPKLRSMLIYDLAEIFSEMSGKPIKVTGIRPGEKMHEALINSSESIRTYKDCDHYVIKPAFSHSLSEEAFEYTSADDVMSKEELKTYLKSINILDKHWSDFKSKSIEEIRSI